jgi:ribosomal RNA methyltransferase Nop2
MDPETEEQTEHQIEITEFDNDVEGSESEDDVNTNMKGDRDQIMEDMLNQEDLGIVKMRIQETIKILSNFSDLRDPNKGRTEYMDDLKTDICQAYGYNNDMIDLFLDLFPPQQCFELIEANETTRPVTIRTNTLKTKRRDLAKVLI